MPKVYSYQEDAEHNGPENFWIIIDDKVYDVSQFKDEHPGGDEIIMDLGGQDATESFVDIGHSDEALRLLKGLYMVTLTRPVSAFLWKRYLPLKTKVKVVVHWLLYWPF